MPINSAGMRAPRPETDIQIPLEARRIQMGQLLGRLLGRPYPYTMDYPNFDGRTFSSTAGRDEDVTQTLLRYLMTGSR